MAEKDTSLAIENAVEQLVKATRILQTVNKLKNLRNSLRQINKIVKEYDGQEYEPEVAEWLREAKEIAYESQNLIGTMVADTNLQNQRGKFRRLLSGGRDNNHHEEKIQNIAKRVKGITTLAGSFKEPCPNDNFNTEKDKVVGFENLQMDLVSDLTMENRPQRDVILIGGKAGSGKTTLAKMVYENIKQRFDHRDWVYIPKELTLEALLGRILTQLCNQTNTQLNEVELKAMLSESLKDTMYLIVLDNIHNSGAWNELLTLLPDDLKGSRVLLTSRQDQKSSAITRSYEIKPLDVHQSWKVLSREVFSGEDCPLNLEIIGKIMVEKCKGSPRAVMALAAILEHAEKTEEMWSKFLTDSQGEQILDLSNYRDQLCGELQLCFLYLGLFQDDFQIPAKQIIRLWMAEGLLRQRGSQRVEEIGKDYLEKLSAGSFIKRNEGIDGSGKKFQISSHVFNFCVTEGKEFIEVHVEPNSNSEPTQKPSNSRLAIHGDSHMDVLGGIKSWLSMKTCQILSHVSNFCVTEGKEFIEVHVEPNSNSEPTQKPSNSNSRLAIHGDSHMDVLRGIENCSNMHVRSLHCFSKSKDTNFTTVPSENLSGILHRNSRHLKVLNLGALQLDRVPKLLAELKLITYLRLRVPNATHLPRSIGNLQCLETLDMRESHQLKVPHELWKIESLRHLYLGEFSIPRRRRMQYYKALPSLQTLYGVRSDKVLKWLMVQAKFPSIRKLRICSLKREVTFKFLNSVDHLSHLESLRVERPTRLPDANAFPLSLENLTLWKTDLQPDCIKKLENLPNLKKLKLLNQAISGGVLECSAQGFLRLEILRMENLVLEQWTVGEGAMPCLKHLSIKGPLAKVPDRLMPIVTFSNGDDNGA